MIQKLHLHPDRLFSSDPVQRDIARRLYNKIKDLPIVSPHGHTDPSWFADNECFSNATELLVQPDHYLLRMLFSHGIPLESLGFTSKTTVPENEQVKVESDPKVIWRTFAEHYFLFQGTPTSIWLDYVFTNVFNMEYALCVENADDYYQQITSALQQDSFKPRALFERFNIEVIATTEGALDDLRYHKKIKESGWDGRVITAFRPDNVTDPEFEGFEDNLTKLAEITGINIDSFAGYLASLQNRRNYFKEMGATSTDHGHPTARTLDLADDEKEALYQKIRSTDFTPEEADRFRAQMLTELASMSIEDGLVMQIHPGVYRNHNQPLFEKFARDKGADIPVQVEFVENLRPLLNKYGCHPKMNIIVFTLDETTYSRELAPLAGHYPALKLGPAWWFHDSPEGMRRYRQQVTETAGFYNTVGFNDDTRAFLSIPARHDVARRMDCAFLAELVSDHRLTEQQAEQISYDLSYNLVKQAYYL
ncbi:glucuronate isomerase [Paraglaciecola sp. L3A3]|uniref:glucuronate isomerase n=1 Tax=Paraglaciecola sp. L3A3 TaxID=2686358 RepID=UPI0018EF202D|nr:glucuronate isomerase [Paraglaciecola sp. L3A3]